VLPERPGIARAISVYSPEAYLHAALVGPHQGSSDRGWRLTDTTALGALQ